MKILKELEEAYYDIPFENSDYQNKVFVMAANQTPARAYRAIGLRMFSKLHAINELKYSRQLEDIDIEEMEYKAADENTDQFERRRLLVKIEQKKQTRNYTDKLLNDAIRELNCLYAEFKKFPRYTREEFEAQEVEYFTKKMQKTLESHGNTALESLETMVAYEDFQKQLLELEHEVHKSIER